MIATLYETPDQNAPCSDAERGHRAYQARTTRARMVDER